MKKVSVFVVFLLYLIVFIGAYTGNIGWWFGFLNLIPFGDKCGHIVLIFLTAWFVSWLTCYKTVNVKSIYLYHGVMITAVFITAEELLQLYSDFRSFEWADMICNWIGAAAAQYYLYRISKEAEADEC